MEENKKYEQTLNKLKAVLNSEKISLPTKVQATDISQIVSDLFKEENENLKTELQNELKTLLKKHVELNNEIAKKRKEVNDLEKNKQKEFIEAADKLLNKIEGVDNLVNEYAKSLETALEGVGGE